MSRVTSLTDCVALVFGGATGIGEGVARRLAREGCRVAIAGRRADALAAAAAAMPGAHPVVARRCDVADRQAVCALIEQVEVELGPIALLVNSAGINVPHRLFADVTPEEFDDVIAANLTGAFNVMHAALPPMRARGDGLIINIVSIAGVRSALLAGAPYVAAKSGQRALGLFANQEANADGVRVTNIYPGEVNTPILDKRPAPPPADVRERMLQPDDVAAIVAAIAQLPPRAVVPEVVMVPSYMQIN
jgi:NADP-dependent 3-hydroxy acid dehydrogenase YdfG